MVRVVLALRAAIFAALICVVAAGAASPEPWFFSAGFEDGLKSPWGTGQQFNNHSVWWNSGGCGSSAEADWRVRRNGNYALRINNPSPRKPEVFGTTQQPVTFQQGHRYRIEVWALGRNLASHGAVSLVVDSQWRMRPIQLPAGTYDWQQLKGEFVWPGGEGQCRILSEDRGEARLDDISIIDLGPAQPTASPQPAANAESIAAAVIRFRQLALIDAPQAIEAFCTPEARMHFGRFDKRVLAELEPETAWSYFFSTGITAAAAGPRQAVVGFYNPWCDAVLLTYWQQGGRFAQIIDAELVAGDWLRTRGAFSSPPMPGWVRAGGYLPATLAKTVAETACAVETTFAGATPEDWRSKLPGLDDMKFIQQVDDPYVALLLIDVLQKVEKFYGPRRDEDARLTSLRRQTAEALKLAAAGKIDELLARTKTPPPVAEILKATPAEAFASLLVVDYLIAEDASIVFLAPQENPDYCLCLVMAGQKLGEATTIELIAYDAVVTKWKQEQGAKKQATN